MSGGEGACRGLSADEIRGDSQYRQTYPPAGRERQGTYRAFAFAALGRCENVELGLGGSWSCDGQDWARR